MKDFILKYEISGPIKERVYNLTGVKCTFRRIRKEISSSLIYINENFDLLLKCNRRHIVDRCSSDCCVVTHVIVARLMPNIDR